MCIRDSDSPALAGSEHVLDQRRLVHRAGARHPSLAGAAGNHRNQLLDLPARRHAPARHRRECRRLTLEQRAAVRRLEHGAPSEP